MEHHLLIETTSKTDWQGQSKDSSCQNKTENKSRSDRDDRDIALKEKKLCKRKTLESSRQIKCLSWNHLDPPPSPTMRRKQLEINNFSLHSQKRGRPDIPMELFLNLLTNMTL